MAFRRFYKVYISGPMTGYEAKNFPAFINAALHLRREGHRVVNPAELDVIESCDSWEECLRRDIREMMKCNSVATLPGWKKSRGALLEVHIAKSLGWPVHAIKYYLKRSR